MEGKDCRILAAGRYASNDTWETGLNNNDLIIGPSGAGKTRGYVMPNLLQCSGSMVITDTKGALRQEAGSVLEQEGYKVMELNLADCAASPYGYNPLAYIRRGPDGRPLEQDILTLAACLIPIEIARDPFWETMARVCVESAISYALECLPRQEQNLASVARLTAETGPDGCYKKLMKELAVMDPGSFAVSRWRLFQPLVGNARTTASCVHGILASKMAPLSFSGARRLFTRRRQLDIKEIGRKKTAVFLNISDTDSSLYRLADVFYAQALHTLCDLADKSPGHSLKVPVRFYLDDFASNAVIPDFDRIISVIRSREISASVIIQSLSQLESIYGHPKAMTIMNNCDTMLCLGAGRDMETAHYISRQADRPISAILNAPASDAWLLVRGQRAEQVTKYNLKDHPLYGRLPEAQGELSPGVIRKQTGKTKQKDKPTPTLSME